MDTDEYIRPPGSYHDIFSHPTNPDSPIEVAVIQDHRFAFFYWLKWSKKVGGDIRPTLVSLDWHQDLAHPDENEKKLLNKLNMDDYREVSLFCWDSLHYLNDGHIVAAAYLNIIGDIHVVQKQDVASKEEYIDTHGGIHTIFCYESVEALMVDLSTKDHLAAIFDVDLDYFTESSDSGGGGADVTLMHEDDIRDCLRPGNELMRWIFPRMCGMTIATEPEFCGGLVNSNNLFGVVNDTLFSPDLLSHCSGWRHQSN